MGNKPDFELPTDFSDSRRVKIASFLSQFVGDMELAEDEDIFATGLVNSMVALDLVQFLERTFSIEIPIEVISIENFSSILAMDQVVLQLQDNRVEG